MTEFVYRAIYEISGEALPALAEFQARVKAYRTDAQVIAERFGGHGFRPAHVTGIQSILVKSREAPEGFKVVSKQPDNVVECKPLKNTKLGKEAALLFASVGARPQDHELAAAYGWGHEFIVGEGKWHWPTVADLSFPTPRAFINIPRKVDDGWSPPAGLTEVTQGQFHEAIEAHNAAVRAAQSEQKDAA